MPDSVSLIREHELAGRFRKALRADGEADIAVPFWGRGAIKLLGLKKANKLRVVCNLDHIGCNPYEIEKITELGHIVWTNRRLHAKVYCTKSIGIVGSSNASSNGLTIEGESTLGWIEANIVGSEPQFVQAVRGAFTDIFEDAGTIRVTKRMLKAAMERRDRFPPAQLGIDSTLPLLEAAKLFPSAFKKLYLIAYDGSLSKNASRVLEEFKADQGQVARLNVQNLKNVWGYQVPGIPADAWLIDLSVRRPSNPKVYGTARNTGLSIPIDEDSSECNLSLAIKSPILIGGHEYNLTSGEIGLLKERAIDLSAASTSGLLKISEVIDILGSTLA